MREKQKQKTVLEADLLSSQSEIQRPEFIRLPRRGQTCPWTALSRSALYGLISSGAIHSVNLRKPGSIKGSGLIHLKSLLDYINGQSGEVVNRSNECRCLNSNQINK